MLYYSEEFFGKAWYFSLPYILQLGIGKGVEFTGFQLKSTILKINTTRNFGWWKFSLRVNFNLYDYDTERFYHNFLDGSNRQTLGNDMKKVKTILKKYLGIIIAVLGLAFLAGFIYTEHLFDLSKYKNLNLDALVDLLIASIAAFCGWAFWDNFEAKGE